MTRAAGGNLLALSLATAVSVAAQAADEIKSGKWEFTTQMQLPGAVQSAPSGQAAGGNAPMTRIACIDAANPIPAEAQCKVDQVDRRRQSRHLGNDLQLAARGDPLRRVGALRRQYDGRNSNRAGPGAQRSAGRCSRPYRRPLSRTLRCQIAVSAATRRPCNRW
jgi:hypothetical protein